MSDFDSDLIICLDPYFGKNVLFVLASCLIFERCLRDVKSLYYLTNWWIFYRYVLGELLCHLFEKLVFKKWLLHQWAYVIACMLFWHCWYHWILTIFSNFSLRVFEALLSQAAGSLQAVPSFSLVCFVETCIVWPTGQNHFDTILWL